MESPESIAKYLSDLGWCPNRHVDPSLYLSSLSGDGYEQFPQISEFLANFGGLDGLMPTFRKEGEYERIHFNPTEAVGNVYREKVSTYESRVGEQLAVVGEAYNGHLSLLLSSNGRLFGAYDDYLCLLGNNVIEGIATLFERREAEEVA